MAEAHVLQTHLHDAVPLVWGSLRLTPMISALSL